MDGPSGPTVFISYSHKDKKWFELLKKHLGALMAEGFFTVWDDQAIRPGEDWYEKILRAISEARVAILLISADYLTSGFVRREEIPRLLRRRVHEGLTIIPVICRPSPWSEIPWLSSMQVRLRNGREFSTVPFAQVELEFTSIAKEVKEIVEEIETPR